MAAYKLTLDGGLLRESVLLPAIQTLKTWESEGKIEIFESDRVKEAPAAYGWPGAPKPTIQTPRHRGAKRQAGGSSFQSLALVLYPSRDPQRLNMTEVNDVAHLLRHQSSGNNIFVTNNLKTFMEGGKRERLQTLFKIMVLTPDEAVAVLRESESWEVSEPTDKKERSTEKRGSR